MRASLCEIIVVRPALMPEIARAGRPDGARRAALDWLEHEQPVACGCVCLSLWALRLYLFVQSSMFCSLFSCSSAIIM